MKTLVKPIDSQTISFMLIVFSVLFVASLLFFVWEKIKPFKGLDELKTRTRSWWMMSSIFLLATVFSSAVSFIAFALLSFMALRELFSILHLRQADRSAVLIAYLAVPVQYLLAYKDFFTASLIFIPVFMFIAIPFRLVIVGQTQGVVQSMAVIPATLMIGLFGLSHLGLLLNLPGGRALLFFLVFITEINDVMQFTTGKLLGRHKIMPTVSPNKTWEGFIGGLVLTTIIGYSLKFLTPFSNMQVILISFIVANAGFIGDVIISCVKRDLAIKDTSHAIPGHGGILDRIDSLIVSAPVFFYISYYLIK